MDEIIESLGPEAIAKAEEEVKAAEEEEAAARAKAAAAATERTTPQASPPPTSSADADVMARVLELKEEALRLKRAGDKAGAIAAFREAKTLEAVANGSVDPEAAKKAAAERVAAEKAAAEAAARKAAEEEAARVAAAKKAAAEKAAAEKAKTAAAKAQIKQDVTEMHQATNEVMTGYVRDPAGRAYLEQRLEQLRVEAVTLNKAGNKAEALAG